MINLSVLKDLTRAKKYQKGAVFLHHRPNSEMYIVFKGEVGVFLNYGKRGEKLISTIGPGSLFSKSSSMNSSMGYTTVAIKDVIAVPISQSLALNFIKEEPEMAFEIIKELCGKLSDFGTAYEKLAGHPWLKTQVKQTKDIVTTASSKISAATTAPAQNAKSKMPPIAVSSQTVNTVKKLAEPELTNEEKQDNASDVCLFPKGHIRYNLPLDSYEKTYLMNKSYTCPICKKSFKSLRVKASKLILDSTDSDMRNRYKSIEPLYYDIVTCPSCFYSALTEMFDTPDKVNAVLPQEIKSLKNTLNFGTSLDADSVFASYYLALRCAPIFFLSHHLITARLLLKLSWIYQDCGDKKMEQKTIKHALDAFKYVYEHIKIAPNLEQQICLIIGELLLKQNDLPAAKHFFFKARTNHAGTKPLHNHAENRMFYIREMLGKAVQGA